MAPADAERLAARLAVVEEHVRCENRHDLDAVMATFGSDARYDDGPWGDRRAGRDGVRSYYGELMSALPDLEIDVKRRHAAPSWASSDSSTSRCAAGAASPPRSATRSRSCAPTCGEAEVVVRR